MLLNLVYSSQIYKSIVSPEWSLQLGKRKPNSVTQCAALQSVAVNTPMVELRTVQISRAAYAFLLKP